MELMLETTTDQQEAVKPIIIDNNIIEGYSISENGTVYSHYKKIGDGNGGTKFIIDYKYRKRMKTRVISGYLCTDISFISGKLGYKYRSHGKSKEKQRKTCSIHQLVIDAWKPFSQHLPKGVLRSDYNNTPDSIKKLLPRLFFINHKDHNKLNNHITNLERVTPRDNARKAKKYYGGNFTNNRKLKS